MNVLSVDFRELYQRHLCRHSQFGINVVHLLSLVGTYLALCGIVYALVNSKWVLLGIAVPYLAVLAFNLPVRVLVANVAFLALFFATFFALPGLSVWVYLPAIVVFYLVQLYSHKVFTRETDMTEFNQKYKKGLALFVLLTVYELPILLNYLLFGQKDWRA
jgi:hypothetical protein